MSLGLIRRFAIQLLAVQSSGTKPGRACCMKAVPCNSIHIWPMVYVLVEALRFLKKLHIIHCDLKPAGAFKVLKWQRSQ